jgi:hypothetical protein
MIRIYSPSDIIEIAAHPVGLVAISVQLLFMIIGAIFIEIGISKSRFFICCLVAFSPLLLLAFFGILLIPLTSGFSLFHTLSAIGAFPAVAALWTVFAIVAFAVRKRPLSIGIFETANPAADDDYAKKISAADKEER